MIYQNPQILYALLALAIPIIIHLFNFRKHEKIYFSSIRFLEEIKTKNKKKRNLKNLLILLSRLLALAFLIIAFAKPYTPVKKDEENTDKIFVYIDNSFSMNAIAEQGRLLDLAKNTSSEIINSFPKTTNFFLITNDFLSIHNKAFNQENIIKEISKVETNGNHKTLNQILKRKNTISKGNDNIYVVSDLQSNTLELDNIEIEDTNQIFFIPIQAESLSNLSIDSVWIDGPILINNRNQKINIKISNKNFDGDASMSLEINNKLKIKQLVSFESNKVKEINFKIKLDSNINICKLSIEDYPINFDNELYFNLIRNKKIKIISINQKLGNNYIEKLYLNDTLNYEYRNQNVNRVNYKNLLENDVIILNQISSISSGLSETLKNCLIKGASLIVVPSDKINMEDYNQFFNKFSIDNFSTTNNSKTFINQISSSHPIFKNVFEGEIKNINFPIIEFHYEKEKLTKTNRKSIYVLENDQDFLAQYNYQKGNIYVFNTPISDSTTNFHKHELFVPTLLNMANNSLTSRDIYNIIKDGDYFVSKNNQNKIFNLSNKEIDIIPTTKIINSENRYYTNNQITKSGQYKLYDKNQIVDHIAYNYNSLESKIEYNNLNNKYLKSTSKVIQKSDVSNFINTSVNDTHYWKSCLLLSLLFFGIEILLLKLIKS